MEIAAIVLLGLLFFASEMIHRERDIRRDRLISELTAKIEARDRVEYREKTDSIPVYPPASKDDVDLYKHEIESNKV